ncbi:MAG: hypothetical protein AAF604_20105 [Acidobacteriota bacterium]
MNTNGLKVAASRAVLGLLQSDELIRVGVQALVSGCDSPSLRILAGLNATEIEEARGMFKRALSELRVAVPGKRDAVMHLARETAKGILSGTTGVYLGAKQIWDLTHRASDEEFPELDSFVYAASEWEDRPEARHDFEEGIVAAAREFVNG